MCRPYLTVRLEVLSRNLRGPLKGSMSNFVHCQTELCVRGEWGLYDRAYTRKIKRYYAPRCSTHSMNEKFGLRREVVIDDIVQQWDVDTAGRHVRDH